jgi:hypothetical protein
LCKAKNKNASGGIQDAKVKCMTTWHKEVKVEFQKVMTIIRNPRVTSKSKT